MHYKQKNKNKQKIWMKVIRNFVNIPCNGQCYRRRTGRSLWAKWKTDKTLEKKVSWASHLIHWLCCACCSVVAVIRVCSSCSSGLCSNFFRCWPSAKGASFASGMPLKAIQADCTRTGQALTSGASDALKTGFTDDEAKPLPAICLRQWRQKGQTTVKTSVKCLGIKLCALKGIYALYLSGIKAEIVLNLLSWPMQVAE